MAGEMVVTNQAGHLLDQVNLPLQVHQAGGGHGDAPTLAVNLFCQMATEGRQGLDDLLVTEICNHSAFLHRPEQVVQGVAPQQQWLDGLLRPLVQPAARNFGSTEFLEELHGPVCCSKGGLLWQALFKTAAGFRPQSDAAC